MLTYALAAIAIAAVGGLIAPDMVSLALDAGGFLALVVGGWLGGRLVYAHGVGGGRT